MGEYVPEGSVAEVHLYHPQPYHDPRQADRRLVTPRFLADVHRGLTAGGPFVVQTDNPDYWAPLHDAASSPSGLFDFEEQPGPWPDAPEGSTPRREILARSRGLRIFRVASAMPGAELRRDEALAAGQISPAADLPEPGLPGGDLDAIEGRGELTFRADFMSASDGAPNVISFTPGRARCILKSWGERSRRSEILTQNNHARMIDGNSPGHHDARVRLSIERRRPSVAGMRRTTSSLTPSSIRRRPTLGLQPMRPSVSECLRPARRPARRSLPPLGHAPGALPVAVADGLWAEQPVRSTRRGLRPGRRVEPDRRSR